MRKRFCCVVSQLDVKKTLSMPWYKHILQTCLSNKANSSTVYFLICHSSVKILPVYQGASSCSWCYVGIIFPVSKVFFMQRKLSTQNHITPNVHLWLAPYTFQSQLYGFMFWLFFLSLDSNRAGSRTFRQKKHSGSGDFSRSTVNNNGGTGGGVNSNNNTPGVCKMTPETAGTLGSGDLKLAVRLPTGEDLCEWVAVNSKLDFLVIILHTHILSFNVRSVKLANHG